MPCEDLCQKHLKYVVPGQCVKIVAFGGVNEFEHCHFQSIVSIFSKTHQRICNYLSHRLYLVFLLIDHLMKKGFFYTENISCPVFYLFFSIFQLSLQSFSFQLSFIFCPSCVTSHISGCSELIQCFLLPGVAEHVGQSSRLQLKELKKWSEEEGWLIMG